MHVNESLKKKTLKIFIKKLQNVFDLKSDIKDPKWTDYDHTTKSGDDTEFRFSIDINRFMEPQRRMDTTTSRSLQKSNRNTSHSELVFLYANLYHYLY